jgi:C1A family cysteine protease
LKNKKAKPSKIKQRSIQYYGWVPDIPDHRDLYFAPPPPEKLPPKIDLIAECPKKVYDQGQLGSCTANAIAAAIEFDLIKEKKEIFTPSRLFIYYNERVIEGTINQDSGAMIRDGIKSVNKQGACHETIWPYVIGKFARRPSDKSYSDALLHQSLSYQRVNRTLDQFKSVLASGYPFVFGFTVYESFESKEVTKTGVVPMPQSKERELGGHAVLAVGYDDSQGRFIVRNSWGQKWGNKGYFTMPYEYLTTSDLSDDFWVIKIVE